MGKHSEHRDPFPGALDLAVPQSLWLKPTHGYVVPLPDNHDSSGTEVLEWLVKDPSSPAELQRMSSEYERLYSLTERLDKKK